MQCRFETLKFKSFQNWFWTITCFRRFTNEPANCGFSAFFRSSTPLLPTTSLVIYPIATKNRLWLLRLRAIARVANVRLLRRRSRLSPFMSAEYIWVCWLLIEFDRSDQVSWLWSTMITLFVGSTAYSPSSSFSDQRIWWDCNYVHMKKRFL